MSTKIAEVRTPTPSITLNGPEAIIVPGNLTKDGYLYVSHMWPNGRNKQTLSAGKFCVCEGVYNTEDADLVGEIIGLRQQQAVTYAQSWTVDSFGRASEAAKANSKHRADQILWDIEILEFVYEEITKHWIDVKKTERFDVACEILQSVVGHVTLGRTTARKNIKKRLENTVNLQDSLHRINPTANSMRISASIPEFINQSRFDYLSERSLENTLQVSLALQTQVSAYIEYLKLCVRSNTVPRANTFNTIYRLMDIKPYSYALAYVRSEKKNRTLDSKEELMLLHDTLSIEYRLSMVSNLCGKLKRSPLCHDSTIEEMITTALFNRNEFLIYHSTIRLIKSHWNECKKQIASGDAKAAVISLSTIQALIRVRMVSTTVDGQNVLVKASLLEGHAWYVPVLEREPLPGPPDNPFEGLPKD